MSDELSYNMMSIPASPDLLNHDVVCTAQAGQLLSAGCLEYETAAYGIAYQKNGEIYYYISSREDSMLDFIKNAYMENLQYTPLRYFFKRFDLLDESEDEIKEKFRLEIAQRLYDSYPDVFFEALNDLTAAPCVNAAYPLVEKIANQLENSFDQHHLNIFENLLDFLLQSRLLSKEGYHIFLKWLHNEREKSSVEPIASSIYRRTYTGFAYEKPDGSIGYFADAVHHLALEKRNNYINKGYLVTLMLTIQYYADSFNNLQKTRQSFLTTLKKYLDTNYIAIMKAFHRLSSGIDTEKYHKYEALIAETKKDKAIEAFQYYGHLWNII